jgi:DNA polymerase elongation subunit (family B)
MQNIALDYHLVIDIETVPLCKYFGEASAEMQGLWASKHQLLKIADETQAESFEKRAGIYAEFGKVICISIGYFHKQHEGFKFRMKSFYGDDEAALLQSFSLLLNQLYKQNQNFVFAGHNIREFDIPYLCRRMMINNVALPSLLNFSGKKPWELHCVDTLHLWRFGDYKNYTSLKLMAFVLGIPSPKEDIEGKDIARVYWHENDLTRIVSYCQRDVTTVARLLLRFRNEQFELSDEDVVVV